MSKRVSATDRVRDQIDQPSSCPHPADSQRQLPQDLKATPPWLYHQTVLQVRHLGIRIAVAGALSTLLCQCGAAHVATTPSLPAAPRADGALTLRTEDGTDLAVTLDGCGWYHEGANNEFGWAAPNATSTPTTRGVTAGSVRYMIYAPNLASTAASVAGAVSVRLDNGASGASWKAVSGTGYMVRTGGAVGSSGELVNVVLQSAQNSTDMLTLGGRWSCNMGQPK